MVRRPVNSPCHDLTQLTLLPTRPLLLPRTLKQRRRPLHAHPTARPTEKPAAEGCGVCSRLGDTQALRVAPLHGPHALHPKVRVRIRAGVGFSERLALFKWAKSKSHLLRRIVSVTLTKALTPIRKKMCFYLLYRAMDSSVRGCN